MENIATTTNNIRFTCNRNTKKGDQIQIVIRLNDECKNGCADFSITGTVWEAGKARCDKNMITSGAIGDKIAKEFPEFEIFNRLHLCDCKGAPMYADGNGFYFLVTQKMEQEKFCSYYRVTPEQFEILKGAEDKEHFKYLLYTVGVVEQWQKEADEAIKQIEMLTGLKFHDDSTRYQLEPLTKEDCKTIEQRLKSGYYSKNAIEQRANDKRKAKRDELEKEFRSEFEKATDKVKKEFDAKMIVLDSNLPLTNFIFYAHSLTGSFNWKGYEKKATQEEFSQFLEYAKNITPEGVTWELK